LPVVTNRKVYKPNNTEHNMVKAFSLARKVEEKEKIFYNFEVGGAIYRVEGEGSVPYSPLHSVDAVRSGNDLSKAIQQHYDKTGELPPFCRIVHEHDENHIRVASVTFPKNDRNSTDQGFESRYGSL
jgi:hypothetical protein